MNIYQQELLRKVQTLGCTGDYDETSEKMNVRYEGILLCKQDKDGYLTYDARSFTPTMCDKLEEIKEQAAAIREYAGMYETAPPMGISDVPEYRRMAEYGDTVLAGMYSEQYGFMFTTWRQSADKSSVAHGDYSPNFDYAKESFITRSGLLDRNRLFTEDEAANLYRCITYTQDNYDSLTYKQERELKSLEEKLQSGYPELEDEPPSFEQADVPQLNM
ncbi:hypothetical protein [Hydrogeniiclostridium mannosilyticum]|uniref:hypothetical protein n=1 Tax=Hydrogeniiclostridium mannosilyticum TaxID=2764322 RepID=UPI00399AE4DC